MKDNKAIIIISDLDGTLLDHNNYRFDAALPALKFVEDNQLPLILNSSKTAAEIKLIRKSLKNHYPFVVENGAGIYLPLKVEKNVEEDAGDYQLIKFGKERKEILSILTEIKQKLKISYAGFNDMSVAELMSSTGLNEQQAELAKQRDFTEPLEWQDDGHKWQLFCQELDAVGLSFAKGGRFISVSSSVDKGQSLNWLKNYYKEEYNVNPIIIALGDSDNDKEMLENADYPVLVKSPVHDFPDIKADNILYTTEYGPAGWNEGVTKLLNSLL
ncbi:MAG: HAD-IIB family hydrolase [Gammaproteobacteria bacterium]|jgi:mannosyl-3-phosphoglycerate phosphatase family protein